MGMYTHYMEVQWAIKVNAKSIFLLIMESCGNYSQTYLEADSQWSESTAALKMKFIAPVPEQIVTPIIQFLDVQGKLC